jgi:hypothetical protein
MACSLKKALLECHGFKGVLFKMKICSCQSLLVGSDSRDIKSVFGKLVCLVPCGSMKQHLYISSTTFLIKIATYIVESSCHSIIVHLPNLNVINFSLSAGILSVTSYEAISYAAFLSDNP